MPNLEKIPDSDREKGQFETIDIIIDKLNEIIEWINNQ